jgi:cellulose synthase (UDP-forming)
MPKAARPLRTVISLGASRMLAEHDLDDYHRYHGSPRVQSRRDASRARRNAAAWRAYVASATIVGPVDHSDDSQVAFRRVASRGERVALTCLVLLNAATALLFIGWLLLPAHIPGHGNVGFDDWKIGVARTCFCVVVFVEVIRLVQNFAVWVFAFSAKDPVPKALVAGWRVAMLTTIVPSKEPLHVAERTLEAMTRVRYRGQVDIWILDEGDDPAVKAMAARLGVRHFSRKGIPEFNTAGGAFRAKTKSGNHNAWRVKHEDDYDVVAQMDPDHVPLPCFLERTLGYFRDPDVAFVVAPQVYGNMYDSWVAHGASVQQYLFSGVVERAGNGLSAPLLIGTNHLYRPAAWQQIGGYQDSICEDHMTSMRVEGTVNHATGRLWKGVYTPDILAIGEAPASWTDYFNQQKRWSFGIWEVLLNRRKLRAGIRLTMRQRLLYGLVQFYYPSVACTVLLGTVATSVYLLLGITAMRVNGIAWVTLWSLNMATWFTLWLWLRRFNLAKHERREIGTPGMLLALFAGPIYVAAGVRAICGRRLKYVVTAKGKLRTGDSARTFALHSIWALAAAALLAISFRLHHDLLALRIWASLVLVAGAGPPVIAGVSRWIARGEASRTVRDRHAWQRDMVEDFTSPDLRLLFDLAAKQSGVSLSAAPQPAGAKPAAGKPAGAKPAAGDPAAAKPAGAKPAAGEPAAAKPAAGKPAAGKPAAGKPAAGKPAGAKPAAGEPAAGKPAAAKPADAKPADGAGPPEAVPSSAPGRVRAVGRSSDRLPKAADQGTSSPAPSMNHDARRRGLHRAPPRRRARVRAPKGDA